MESKKYPKTFHLPWSPGITSDDKVLKSLDQFIGQEVVVTEKADGENTTIEHGGGCHARSLDSSRHPSRDWVCRLAGTIGHDIPAGWQINGENVYAIHSIVYTALPAYFLVFGIVNERNVSLSWDEVCLYSELLGLHTVPVLYRGVWDEEKVKACYTGVSRCGGVQEGYVVRLASSFEFSKEGIARSLGKFVRAGHVQTDEHWMSRPVVPNKLKSE